MEFKFEHCNNIKQGTLQFVPSKLNIKFGINGTGKSTIAKAIKYSIESTDKLKELTPFNLRSSEVSKVPTVSKPEEINSVFIFNEEYLNQFLYKKDELISNSFEIFVKTPNYIESIEKIEEILTNIKKVFSENAELERIIIDFDNLSKSFATTQTGLSKSSSLYKGLKDGNKVEHIPEALKGYSPFIKDKSCTNWLDWQIKGAEFVDISEDCPYCTSPTTDKKETIKSVSKVYDKSVIKNFNIIIEAIINLGDYFADDAKATLESITKKQTGLEDSEIEFIVSIKKQIDLLLLKLKSLREISPRSFKDDEKAEEKLKGLVINIALFDRFKSQKTENIITSLNVSLNTVLTQIGLLQGEINKQKQQTKKLIEQHQSSINTFLKNAGYKYVVEITDSEGDDYKLKLRHIDSEENISGGNQHLSFGEKNAFALVLFMFEALAKNPDLIVLDDPISSFDKNKKYALMHMLFRGDKCLKNKSVLLLTHDIDPVIDTMKVLKEFRQLTHASFLCTQNGILTEKEITKAHLLTFSQICDKMTKSPVDTIIKCIYLRRNYEIINELGNEYQVLSNILHKRAIVDCKDFRKEPGNDSLSNVDFSDGVVEIKKKLPEFDYDVMLQKISDNEQLRNIYKSSADSYIKLHLFRIINEDSLSALNGVLRKFINESYHVENEQVCQLDPSEFDLIPSFVIEECDKYFN